MASVALNSESEGKNKPRLGGRPKGSISQVGRGGFDRKPLNQAHASFVNAVLLSSTSSIRVVDAARQYLPALVEDLPASAIHAIARRLYRAFIHAGAMRAEAMARSVATAPPSEAARIKNEVHHIRETLGMLRAAEPHASWNLKEQAVEARPKIPSLEEWMAIYESERPHIDLAEFSEAELLEIYRDELGLEAEQVPVEDAEVSTGQTPALTNGPNWADLSRRFISLAPSLCVGPTASDSCGRWLTAPIAAALRSGGIHTLEELRGYIERHGSQWWRPAPNSPRPRPGIDGIGPTVASRLVRWLQDELGAGGKPVLRAEAYSARQRGIAPRQAPTEGATDVYGLLLDRTARARFPKRPGPVAIEYLETWPELEADIEAARTWLMAKPRKSASIKAYLGALERFFLWCAVERHSTPSALRLASLDVFAAFLAEPPDSWFNPRAAHRHDPTWRPMRGPLKESSLGHNLRIVRAFLQGL